MTRTPSKTRCWPPSRASPGSRDGARCAPGSTGSPPTGVSTRCRWVSRRPAKRWDVPNVEPTEPPAHDAICAQLCPASRSRLNWLLSQNSASPRSALTPKSPPCDNPSPVLSATYVSSAARASPTRTCRPGPSTLYPTSSSRSSPANRESSVASTTATKPSRSTGPGTRSHRLSGLPSRRRHPHPISRRAATRAGRCQTPPERASTFGTVLSAARKAHGQES